MEEKTIGALAKFTGISVHTIKYYEKIGLISSHRDEHSNYRSYSVRVCTDIYECVKFRNMEFSLKATAQLLKEADGQMLDHMLAQRSNEIDQEIQRLERLKDQVDQYRQEVDRMNECLGNWYIEQIPHLYVYQQTQNLEDRKDAPMQEDLFRLDGETAMYQSVVTFSKDYLNGGIPDFSWGNGIFREEERPELEERGLLHVKKGRAFVYYQSFTGSFTSNGDMAQSIQKIYHQFQSRFLSDAYAVRIKIDHEKDGTYREYFKIVIPLK